MGTVENKVLKNLNDQRINGEFCDVIFKLKNYEYKVYGHFCVIAPQSTFVGGKYFVNSATNVRFSMYHPLIIEIFDFTCNECLQMMFDYMYSKDIIIPKEHEAHFLLLSKILEVPGLINILSPIEGYLAQINNEFSQIGIGRKDTKAVLDETRQVETVTK